MRRRRMVMAGAALVASTVVAAPVHADETNSACRRFTNVLRQAVHEVSDENVNKEFNQIRNELCKNLHK